MFFRRFLNAKSKPIANNPLGTDGLLPDPAQLIRLHAVRKVYTTGTVDYVALKGIDLQVKRGEFVAIVGKSGSGKSTLINMMTGIDRPSSGEVWINGAPLHTMNEDELARWRGRNLGIVFQFFQLLPTLTLLENVLLPMDFAPGFQQSSAKAVALQLLAMVDMADHAHKLPSAVSGGQQQRMAIARALANDPPLLIADEPTGNLDSRTAEVIFQLFEQLVQQGKTIIMVTHDQDLAQRANRIITIADGEIAEPKAEEQSLAEKPKDETASYTVLIPT